MAHKSTGLHLWQYVVSLDATDLVATRKDQTLVSFTPESKLTVACHRDHQHSHTSLF